MLLSFVACLVLFKQGGDGEQPETPVRPEFYSAPTKGPTLSVLLMRVTVRAKQAGGFGTVTMPVPGDYYGQGLDSLRIECRPTSALHGWVVRTRADGLNRELVAVVSPGAGPVTLGYDARVFLPEEDVVRTQKRDFSGWLGPTALVPSTSAIPRNSASQGTSREDVVRQIVLSVAREKVVSSSLSDESFVRACKCAGALRALRIPARLMEVVPTWNKGGDASYWVCGYGADNGTWLVVDPTVGLTRPARNSLIVIAIPSRVDESMGSVVPGATARGSDLKLDPSTTVRLIRTFPRASGSRLLPAAWRRSRDVMASIAKGRSYWLDDAEFEHAMAQGPTNLALYLDGVATFPSHK